MEIYKAMAAKKTHLAHFMYRSKSFPHPSRPLFLFLVVFFTPVHFFLPFSANLRREMIISQFLEVVNTLNHYVFHTQGELYICV